MKKRISELLSGKIDYKPDGFEISDEMLTGKVMEEENFRGKFTVRAAGAKGIHCFIYSENPRVVCRPAMFVGSRETISYEADTRGLHFGDVVEGVFCICSSAGERLLPYRIEIEKRWKGQREIGDLRITPEEFAALAKEDFSGAYVMFVAREFSEVVQRWGGIYPALYEGIRGQSVSYYSLEQFLVGAGQKEPLTFAMETDHVYFHDLEETRKEELMLTKSGWGFSEISVTSDGDFLTVERSRVTTDEFVGSIYNITYLIHKEKLHAGRNFAQIRVRSGAKQYTCTVEVRSQKRLIPSRLGHRQKQEIAGMLSAYINYRAGRLAKQEWAQMSLHNIENYRKAQGNHIFFDLYEIWLLFGNDDLLQAELLLEAVTARKKELSIPQWKGCYLYLTTLQNKDGQYMEYVREEVHRLFLENQENWILQWLMFELNGHLIKNDSEKLDLVRRQYLCGCKSPVMYLEAYDIMKREPLMLRSLEQFEIHLLHFICREQLLDRELSGQVAQLACRYQEFNPVLFRILESCFSVYPTKNLLTAICAMLIRGRKKETRYGKWFALGIRQDVRITGMYEYYVETMGDLQDQTLPAAVKLYFNYHNTLDYVKKAAIYANILRNRKNDPDTYDSYRREMERFMEEQLMLGRVNTDLALLYECFLSRELMDVSMAKGLVKVLYTYEISCENDDMRQVVVVHEPLAREQRVSINNGRAYVCIYSPDCCIFLEDAQGRRYCDSRMYTKQRLLSRPLFEDYCREILPESVGLLIHDCCNVPGQIKVTDENVLLFGRLLRVEGIKKNYLRAVQKELTQYYMSHPAAPGRCEFLEMADSYELVKTHKSQLTELLIQEGMSEKAYDIVKEYGAEGVKKQSVVCMCSCLLAETWEEDPLLLKLCSQCFSAGVYDVRTLRYLMKYYEGPVETMKALWSAGRGFELEDFALEEKTLALILFMQQGMEDSEDIFASYCRKQGKERICRAYVTLMSYEYFVREKEVKAPVFEYLCDNMLGNVNVPQVCHLALLRYYSGRSKRSLGENKWMCYLLDKFVSRDMYFAFYKKLPGKLQRQFHMNDKHILEYRTDPKNDVIIHYRLNGGKERTAVMKNTFEGIFTETFTLFYQDTLEWYFTVDMNGKKMDTPLREMTNTRRSVSGATSRYDLINRLIEAQKKQDERMYREVKEQYIGQQYLVDELFEIN